MRRRIRVIRGTAAQWTAADPLMGAGEFGLETDTGKLKVGTGGKRWSELSYISAGGGGMEQHGNDYHTPDMALADHTHLTPWDLMTTTEMNAIPAPTEGMTVWNTTEHQLYVYDGVGWVGVVMQA